MIDGKTFKPDGTMKEVADMLGIKLTPARIKDSVLTVRDCNWEITDSTTMGEFCYTLDAMWRHEILKTVDRDVFAAAVKVNEWKKYGRQA